MSTLNADGPSPGLVVPNGVVVAKAAAEKPRFYRKLYVQVLMAVALGAILGHQFPDLSEYLKPYGDAFIKAIKVVVAPIIFSTIVVGIAKMGDIRRVANVGLKALIYFEVASTLALVIGMVVGHLWKVGVGINADPASFDTRAVENYAKVAKHVNMTDFFLSMIPTSFVEPFVKGDILPVLFIALLLGMALSLAQSRGKPIVSFLESISVALFGMVRIIMYVAPLAAFCAMAFTVGKYGLGTLLDLGQLVASVYVVSILFVVLVLGGFLRLAGFNIFHVLGYFKEEIIFVFAATSAETMMPRSMQKLEKVGVSKEVVGLVMPGGFSFNMDGTAIYMTMAVQFLAHAFNVELTIWHQLSALLVMLFTSKGAAGVTGGGFIALAATLPVLDSVPIAGLALLLGVDRFMAEIRAATNLTSNIIATLVVGRWVGAVDMKVAAEELRTGFVETEETRSWDMGHSAEIKAT
ncbi:Na+/H+-dicarboxylate symporter [Rhodopseudomonas rhenobacensis]|uniref:Na+/H+-dicarboxylate symporter n=1 Tax=Rhodopseudomonas rhenobacensis TaxID=87461 RepID=A0A7W7Z3K3_9BRAD|nr:C4-dicarboxylate transporter DctA [Rhodopseudomonas rhenobacensis]MBB5047294.1 Na+/H+-dicarboxylate symporter [Rhodopseudomonas rhenobacensis]